MKIAIKPRKKPVSLKKIGIIIIITIVVLAVALLSAIPPLIMSDMLKRPVKFETHSAEEYGVEAKSVLLKTEDHLSIAAWEVEQERPKGIVILLSGIHNPSVTEFFGYSKMLRDNGYASLLIEMRAHGESEGELISLGMKEILDVNAGVDYIKSQEKYQDAPVIIWGTSMGGTTAINAIGENPDIDGLISCSAFSTWPDAFSDNMKLMDMPSFLAAAEKPFVWMYMGIKYGLASLKINPINEIQKLNGRPALLLHSTGDSQVPYANFERIKAKAPDHVETFVREGDNHFIIYEQHYKNPAEDTEFAGVVLNFLRKHFS